MAAKVNIQVTRAAVNVKLVTYTPLLTAKVNIQVTRAAVNVKLVTYTPTATDS